MWRLLETMVHHMGRVMTQHSKEVEGSCYPNLMPPTTLAPTDAAARPDRQLHEQLQINYHAVDRAVSEDAANSRGAGRAAGVEAVAALVSQQWAGRGEGRVSRSRTKTVGRGRGASRVLLRWRRWQRWWVT